MILRRDVKVCVFVVVVLLTLGVYVEVALAGRGNDTIYKEGQYREYFKQEGKGDKNYLYTVTEHPAPAPGKCLVFTFASEQAGSVVCNTNPS